MNISHIRVIAQKELAGITQEKTILFAILLQLFIALFSSFLMVGLTAMYDPNTLSQYSGVMYGVAYCGEESSVSLKLEKDSFITPYYMDLSTAVQLLKERKLAAVLYIADGDPDDEKPFVVTMYTLKNDLQAAVIEMKLKEILLLEEEELRIARTERLTQKPVSLTFPQNATNTSFYEFIYGLLIPLLLFMPAFISAALVIDLITEEYEQQTLDTIRSTPVTMRELIFGKLGATILLVPIQAGTWLILLIVNGVAVSHLIEILIFVFAGSAILILIAAVIAMHYTDRTSAQFVFSTAAVIIMLAAVSIPFNPLNIVAQLASGDVHIVHGIVLMMLLLGDIMLAGLVTKMADTLEFQ